MIPIPIAVIISIIKNNIEDIASGANVDPMPPTMENIILRHKISFLLLENLDIITFNKVNDKLCKTPVTTVCICKLLEHVFIWKERKGNLFKKS